MRDASVPFRPAARAGLPASGAFARTALALLAALAAAAPCAGAGPATPNPATRSLSRLAGLLGPKTLPAPPDWANRGGPPLFSFAWASDMHLDESRRARLAQAMRFIDEELKPQFLLITGDNNAITPGAAGPNDPSPPALRRQRFLKDWLASELKSPYAIIPGDNWPQEFDRVFGPSQYSFDCGGLHFILLAPDRAHHRRGLEGLSVFDGRTLEWLRADLEKNRERPALVAIHEPVFPPTFLDAPRLRKLLDGYPNVLAVLQGHLHADVELTSGGRAYLVAPALGPGEPPALKHVLVHRHALVVRTAEYDEKAGRFALVEKWQKIDVPEALQKALSAPPAGRFVPANHSCVPAHAQRDDPALIERVGELAAVFQAFLREELPRLLLQAAGR